MRYSFVTDGTTVTAPPRYEKIGFKDAIKALAAKTPLHIYTLDFPEDMEAFNEGIDVFNISTQGHATLTDYLVSAYGFHVR